MTLDDAPLELFKSKATSLHSSDLPLVYSMFGSTDFF